ncbi:ABC transporter substrate-binding protein [Jeotgalibaca ciconiae]|uniref:Extracellular solute-binding protein n=1 Tax=Jeotgalibaca ciconiae TaxID=2496265 RepID=A0A3S9HBU0_9LACT|nr:extracellular solute-binding protein [Jeotgalibaca ciconiae]AZP04839.1 extracellular solute-binding protein [Jeotgalibaca ciconiae]
MMKEWNYKKIGKFGLGLTTALLLAACGGNGDSGNAGSGTDEGSTEASGNKVTFVSWLTEQKDLDQAVLDAYLEENPEADIEFVYVGDNQTANYYQQVDLMLMGGDEIDIVMTGSYPDHAQRAASGSYLALQEYFDNEGVDPKEEYIDSLIAPVNDTLYGIPGDAKSWIVYMNKEKLDEAGLEVPPVDWTWEDYAEYAEALTEDGTYGSYFHTWDHYNYLNIWSLRLGNAIMNEDGTLAFDAPKFKEFLEFRKKMEEDGVQMPYQTIKATNASYRDRFFNGEIAMLPLGTFLIPELEDTSSFPHDFETTFAMMPRDVDAPEGRTYTEALYYAIASSSDAPQEAYDFLRFYTTEGAKIKGVNLPTKADEDKMEYVNLMVEDDTLVDMEALETVLNNPQWEDNPNTTAPAYQRQLTDMMVEEVEKYFLGNDDVDTVIQNMMTRGQQIIDENQ